MAEPDQRVVEEGQQYQGASEVVAYTINLGNVAPPADAEEPLSVGVRDVWAAQWVTETVMPDGEPTLDDENIVTLPPLMLLTPGRPYLIELLCVVNGNTLSFHIPVWGQE